MIGTTFAWFTDSVTSAGNIIKSGKLDVAMYWANGDEAIPTDKTGWKDASAGAIFKNDKWEPGYTEARHIKIANEGTLALKYQLAILPTGEVSKLAEVIDVYYADPAAQVADRTALTDDMKIGTLADVLADMSSMTGELPAGESHTVTLVLKMQESADNEYQELSIGSDFTVRLLATQLAAENDSFGPDYDEDAWVEGMVVYTASDLQAAINAGENVILMKDIVLDEAIVIPASASSTFSLRAAAPAQVINLNGKNITIDAAYDSSAETANSAIVNNGNAILTGNGTVKAANNYTVRNYGNMIIDGINVENGVMNFADLTVEGGNISNSRSGKHTIYGNNAKLTINGGTFYNGNPGNAAIFSYGGEATINGGEFSIADGTATQGWTSCLIDAQGNAKFTINGGVVNGEIRDYNKNTVIYGGTFSTDPSAYVADGYQAVRGSDGNYRIVKGDVVASDSASLNDALANGESNVALGAGDFSMPSTSGDITISGTEDTVITINKPTANKVSLNGVTVVGSGNYTGIQHSDTVIYENCVIKGVQFLYANTVKFIDCTIDLTAAPDYIWTYDAKNVEFIGCTFNTAGKAILIYHEGATLVTNVSVTGCTFNATASALASGHVAAAIEIDSSLATNGHYTLTTSGNIVDEDFSGEWRVKKSGTNNTTVNGVIYNKVDDGLYKNDGVTYYVYNANGLAVLNGMMANASAGRDTVVNLTSDIDFSGKVWVTVDSHADSAFEIAEINGNGHTIYNLTINGQAMFRRFAGTGDVVIKDITFDGATVTSNALNTSILTVQTYQNTLLDNVDVKNSTITGTYKVAPLIATVYNESETSITATLKNCDVSDTTVISTMYDFFTCGMVAFVYTTNNDYVEYENCTVTNVALKSVGGGYNYHANIHYTSADTDDQINEHPGVTVTNVTFEKIN